SLFFFFFFFQAEDGIRDKLVTGVQTCALPISEPRGTAGALKFAESMLEERFVMLNGDVLTDLDLSAQIAQHAQTGAKATLALVRSEERRVGKECRYRWGR